jgi:hypothetical protein
VSQGFENLGSDYLGSATPRRKYPRGDTGRSRPPLNSGRRYEYALSTGAIIFFDEGKRGELGGSPHELKDILGWLGLKLDCASTIPMDYYLKREAESRAKGEANRNFFIGHAAHEYQMPPEYVQELLTREYLYRDEIDPRWELSSLASLSLIEQCLPAVIRQESDESANGFKALTMLLHALPGSVYSANLLEFMFEHHEANGRTNIRSEWAAARR